VKRPRPRTSAAKRSRACAGAGLSPGCDGLERVRQRPVPEVVEAGRQRSHSRPGQQRVHVDEVRRLAAAEVFVGNVATAGHCEAVVGNEELVVHAPVHALDLVQRQQHTGAQAAAAHRQRIEHAHLGIGMRGQTAQQFVLAAGEQVVDQQAHAHATLRGVAQLAKKLPARGVVGHHVVLRVDGVDRGLCERHARVEGLVAVRQQPHARDRGVRCIRCDGRRQRRRRDAPERTVTGLGPRLRRHPVHLRRQRRATRQQRGRNHRGTAHRPDRCRVVRRQDAQPARQRAPCGKQGRRQRGARLRGVHGVPRCIGGDVANRCSQSSARRPTQQLSAAPSANLPAT
jgi:hypothetical protein